MLLERHDSNSTDNTSNGFRLVWIDQLCIDQTNNKEKSFQVAMMSEIFSKARTVFAWTGVGDETTADALTALDRFFSVPIDLYQPVELGSFTTPKAFESKLRSASLTVSHWLGLITFLYNSYFKRTWIIQEVCLNSNVVFVVGKDMVPWAKFSSALSFLVISRWLHHFHTEVVYTWLTEHTIPKRYRNILSMVTACENSALSLYMTKRRMLAIDRPDPLMRLLNTHRLCKATNPADKVYALLGVSAKDCEPFTTYPELSIADYDMPVKAIYTRTTRGLMQSHEDLGLLAHIEARPLYTKIEGLPSWVPDFSTPLSPAPMSFRTPCWDVGNCVTWKRCSGELSDSLLEVRGFCIGSVIQTSLSVVNVQNTSPSQSNLIKDSEANWTSLCDVAHGLTPYYPIMSDS